MASTQDLKRRVRSVQNTRKITKAMELVASARLRRAQARIETMRPYADKMLELMSGVARASVSTQRLPLLQRREPQTTAILAADGRPRPRGRLQLADRAARVRPRPRARGRGSEIRWLVSGKKGRSTLRFRGYDVASDWAGFSDRPAYSDAQAIAHTLTEQYVAGEVDRVIVVYNHFESPLVQKVAEQEVLPIPEHLLETDDEERRDDAMRGDFIYEPEPEEILARLLPVYLETELYRALLESAASEQGARMTAMRNASKNAAELIDSLTLAMNRARQAEITQEILEVVAGADALEG